VLLVVADVDLRQVTSSLLRSTFQPFNTPFRRAARESVGLVAEKQTHVLRRCAG
jgi:hypothetical protein